jgi:hypothetical protein
MCHQVRAPNTRHSIVNDQNTKKLINWSFPPKGLCKPNRSPATKLETTEIYIRFFLVNFCRSDKRKPVTAIAMASMGKDRGITAKKIVPAARTGASSLRSAPVISGFKRVVAARMISGSSAASGAIRDALMILGLFSMRDNGPG